MTNPELPKPIAPAFNFVQRSIQGVFGTREFAVVLLIVFCFAVEVGILAATQQYEANTNPTGTSLFLGMSAAGMVVFFAEVLKLPVAWVSGVVHGRRRWTLNIITFGLCVLTAITIKDLTVYEWNLALEPSRQEAEQAVQLRSQVEMKERQIADLSTNAEKRRADLNGQLEGVKSQIDALQSDRDKVNEEFAVAKRALDESLLDPTKKQRLDALTTQRTEEEAEFSRKLRALQDEQGQSYDDTIRAWELAVAEANASNTALETQADKQYQDALADYELKHSDWLRRGTAYANDCASIDAKLERDISGLKGDLFGFEKRNLEEQARVAKEELKRSKYGDLKEPTRPVKTQPKLTPVPPRPTAPQVQTNGESVEPIDVRINRLRSEYEVRRAELNSQIEGIRQSTSLSPRDGAAYKIQLAELERSRDESLALLNEQIAGLRSNQRALQEDLALLEKPSELAKKLEALQIGLPELRLQASAAESKSLQLAEGTNPFRFSRGILRWLMPNATRDQQVEAAYAVFPPLIAILVATLPALLLELGVSSLRPDVVAMETRRPPLLHRLSRRRRALLLLQHRAAMASQRAQSTLEQVELRREALLAEHEQRQRALSREVEEAVAERLKELQMETSALQSQITEAQKREAALASQLADTTTQLRKLSEDNAALAAHVVHLDARQPVARS